MQVFRVKTDSNVLVERFWPLGAMVMEHYSSPGVGCVICQAMVQASMRRLLVFAGLQLVDQRKVVYRDC